MDMNPFKDIVGPDFPCQAEPPLPDSKCPCISGIDGGPQLSARGSYYCPTCYSVVGFQNGEDDDLFDEEDAEEDAFAGGEVFVAEGNRPINRTPEEALIQSRLEAVQQISQGLHLLDVKMATFLVRNEYTIVDQLRRLELADEPAFRVRYLGPKLLAVATHMGNLPIDPKNLRAIGINPVTYASCLRAIKIIMPTEAEDSPLIKAIRYVANAIDLSKEITDHIIEQYEENPLYNREPDNLVRAAAYIYIKTQQAGIKISQAKLKAVPGVKQNALPRAIAHYREQLRNGNNRAEAENSS